MKHEHRDGHFRWSERLYAVILSLYPRRFRDAYGDAMRQVFRDLLRERADPVWRIWFAVCVDIWRSVLPEHVANLTEGETMNVRVLTENPLFRRAVGCGLVLGLAWTIYSLINNAFNLSDRG